MPKAAERCLLTSVGEYAAGPGESGVAFRGLDVCGRPIEKADGLYLVESDGVQGGARGRRSVPRQASMEGEPNENAAGRWCCACCPACTIPALDLWPFRMHLRVALPWKMQERDASPCLVCM